MTRWPHRLNRETESSHQIWREKGSISIYHAERGRGSERRTVQNRKGEVHARATCHGNKYASGKQWNDRQWLTLPTGSELLSCSTFLYNFLALCAAKTQLPGTLCMSEGEVAGKPGIKTRLKQHVYVLKWEETTVNMKIISAVLQIHNRKLKIENNCLDRHCVYRYINLYENIIFTGKLQLSLEVISV